MISTPSSVFGGPPPAIEITHDEPFVWDKSKGCPSKR
jgi:hypothetical protein